MDDTTRTTVPGYATEPSLRDRSVQPPIRTMARRMLRLISALTLLIGLGFALNHWLQTRRATPQGRAAQSAPQPVGAATGGTGDIRIIVSALGTVTPIATVTVTTQISGQLTEVGFKEGQHVKKGDFLVQIDPRPYEAALEQAEGLLAHDQGLLDQARVNSARYQNLAKTQAIARQTAEDQVALVKQYEGTVKADQAQIETQKLNLIYCHIVSPVDGRVGLRLVDAGNYLQAASATGIAVITQLQPITVIFPIPEDNLPQIQEQLHEGKTLEVMVYDRANVTKLATGRVVALDSQIDTSTGTVKLRAEFDNADEKLFPNQFVNARLLVRILHDVVTIPIAAVQGIAPSTYVYLINADDTVSVRPIKLGPTDGETTQVESGLAAGDRVVVDGADRLRDGARVTIRGEGNQRDGRRPDQPAQQNRQSPNPDASQR
jgi:multidrug efflux system membrane fusion protein